MSDNDVSRRSCGTHPRRHRPESSEEMVVDPDGSPSPDAARAARRARDGDLVRRLRLGDQGAFGELYDDWFDAVYDVAHRILRRPDLAAEVSQEAFLAAWRRLATLEQPEAFGGWLLRIARNGALNRHQKEQRSTAVDDQGLAMIEATGTGSSAAPAGFTVEDRLGRAATPEAAAEDHEIIDLVWDAATALPERDLEVLDLQLRQGFSPAEVGEQLGINRNAANQLVHRLRGRLETAVRARVIWRAGEPDCDVLRSRLAEGGITQFDADAVRVIERHLPGCSTCDERQRLRLQPAALFAAVPIMVAPLVLKQEAAAALTTAGLPMQGSVAAEASLAAGPGETGSGGSGGEGSGPEGSGRAGSGGEGSGGEGSGGEGSGGEGSAADGAGGTGNGAPANGVAPAMASGGLPEGFPRIAAARPVAAPAPPVRREHRPRTGAGLGIAAVLLLMLVVVVALGRDDGDTTALVTAAGRGTSTTGTTPPATAAPLTESTAPIATVATTAAPTAVPTTPAPTVVPTTRPPRTTSTAAATETTAAPTSEVTIPLGPGRPTVGTTFRMAPVTAPPAWASGATGESAPTLGWSVRSSVPVTIRITGPHRGQAGYEIDPRPGYFVVCPQVTTVFGPDLCTASPTGDGYTMVVSELDGTVLATRTAFLAPPG